MGQEVSKKRVINIQIFCGKVSYVIFSFWGGRNIIDLRRKHIEFQENILPYVISNEEGMKHICGDEQRN